MGVEKGKSIVKSLKCGICGEHGGDPASIAFCHSVGLDYVSCSPFRVPIARLSAAQAAVRKAKSLVKQPTRVPPPAAAGRGTTDRHGPFRQISSRYARSC